MLSLFLFINLFIPEPIVPPPIIKIFELLFKYEFKYVRFLIVTEPEPCIIVFTKECNFDGNVFLLTILSPLNFIKTSLLKTEFSKSTNTYLLSIL